MSETAETTDEKIDPVSSPVDGDEGFDDADDVKRHFADGGAEDDETEPVYEAAPQIAGDETFSEAKSKRGRSQYVDTNKDHYAVLGLEDLRYDASPRQIRNAYKKLVLKHHPDKLGEAATEEDVAKFREIQEAGDILMDPASRRAFDTEFEPFADGIPSATKDESVFFKSFSECFERNSRWSTLRPVPALGGMDTLDAEIDRFYDFWLHFGTWRDFSKYDEYDPETAEDKFERRWMERANERDREKRRKKELSRIRSLVETAYDCDPRIRRRAEREREQRRKAKEERLELRRRDEEKKRLEREEAERIAAERVEAERLAEEAERKKRQKEKKVVRKERQRLRNALTPLHIEFEDDLMLRLTLSELRDAVEKVTAGGDKSVAYIGEIFEKQRRAVAEEASANEEARARMAERSGEAGRAAPSETVRLTPWTEEDIGVLARATTKFPGGTRNRWEQIQVFLPHKSIEEIIEQTNVLRRKAVSAEVVHSMAVKADSQSLPVSGLHVRKTRSSKKEKLEEVVPSSVLERDVSVTESNQGECHREDENVPPAPWTASEQKLLEAALMKYPSSLPTGERWRLIAADVPGRNRKECLARIKELRANMQALKK